jgi:hypothetical protein
MSTVPNPYGGNEYSLYNEFVQQTFPVSFIVQHFIHKDSPAALLSQQTEKMNVMAKYLPPDQKTRQVLNLKHPNVHRFY